MAWSPTNKTGSRWRPWHPATKWAHARAQPGIFRWDICPSDKVVPIFSRVTSEKNVKIMICIVTPLHLKNVKFNRCVLKLNKMLKKVTAASFCLPLQDCRWSHPWSHGRTAGHNAGTLEAPHFGRHRWEFKGCTCGCIENYWKNRHVLDSYHVF